MFYGAKIRKKADPIEIGSAVAYETASSLLLRCLFLNKLLIYYLL